MDKTLHIYARVSTSIQEDEGTSIDTQINAGIERAKKLNYSYVVWNEGGQSSAKDDLSNRPKLTEVLKRIDDGEIKHLYVWNTDRLSRNLTTWGMIRFQLIRNNVNLHTPTGTQILSDPQTNLMIGILSEISQYDNQLRTERFRLGKLARVRQGNWMGGPPPYGYKIEKHRLHPHPDEQKWVEYIYTAYRNGATIDQLRKHLMMNGVITRRGKVYWSHATVDKILTNTHYSGYYNYTDKKTGERIRVDCPQLLPADLIFDVKEARKKRSYNNENGYRSQTSNQKYSYLLSGLLFCAHCGSRYGGNQKTKQTSYYACTQKTVRRSIDGLTKCKVKRNIRIDTTDHLVWNTVLDVLSESHTFKESIKLEMLDKKSYQLNRTEQKRKTAQLKKLKKELDQITESIVNIETSALVGRRNRDEINAIINRLEEHRLSVEAQHTQTQAELFEVKNQQKWVDWLSEFATRLRTLRQDELDIETKKRFLQGVLDKITIKSVDKTTHELDLHFRLPYVGDELIHMKQSSSGPQYRIKPGTKTKTILENLVKKTTTCEENPCKI
mgnify:FL=1